MDYISIKIHIGSEIKWERVLWGYSIAWPFLKLFTYQHTCMLSCFIGVRLLGTPWTVTCQAPLFIGFSRQAYWSELPCPPPGDLPNPGIKPMSLMSPALAGRFFTTSTNLGSPQYISGNSYRRELLTHFCSLSAPHPQHHNL